ncbi:endonuclease/exonuclease/phosphatase family protein [Longimicrobium sp.]|uniref:endonuclease/exonuclease/phosphatase family protein n=1 Tax=Longimicrobium sp. TaxID=2029185 RepID=UPI002E302145|nr:endonuclease/exonuclease/phosphatase family protein [Longimicrobium sp.]HEX6038530.1 endonuclease/exonuclease/phosphatase family protein [Longimicrobium sp.]
MLLSIAKWVTVGSGLLAVLVTLVSLHSSPHWSVRLWDFPRVQIGLVAAAACIIHALFFSRWGALDLALGAATAGTALWQGWKIFPYTPVAPLQVKWSDRKPSPGKTKRPSFRLLITNVLMENTQHDRILRVIDEADPDVVLAVETDHTWAAALQPLRAKYPHGVDQPQDNWYGMMLFSRLELEDCKIEFLVQDDIPSVFAKVLLPDGPTVYLRGIHPRPPEPIRDQDSTPRDAELVLVGKLINEAPDQPTVVAGDLNDVAWSPTSQLFARLAGLLDPRRGRGFYNSYNANNPFLRYPLDHVFHSHHFRLVALRRLPNIGSDHFPMMVELSYEYDAPIEQPKPEMRESDPEEAEEKIEKQLEAAATGDDMPGRE